MYRINFIPLYGMLNDRLVESTANGRLVPNLQNQCG